MKFRKIRVSEMLVGISLIYLSIATKRKFNEKMDNIRRSNERMMKFEKEEDNE